MSCLPSPVSVDVIVGQVLAALTRREVIQISTLCWRILSHTRIRHRLNLRIWLYIYSCPRSRHSRRRAARSTLTQIFGWLFVTFFKATVAAQMIMETVPIVY